jgi:hypothetical protein
MKTSKKTTLKDVLHLLMEEGAPINPANPQPIPMELQNLSLDMKVDSYFMKYKKKFANSTKLSSAWNRSRRSRRTDPGIFATRIWRVSFCTCWRFANARRL